MPVSNPLSNPKPQANEVVRCHLYLRENLNTNACQQHIMPGTLSAWKPPSKTSYAFFDVVRSEKDPSRAHQVL